MTATPLGPYRPVAAIGLAAAVLLYVGCSDTTPTPPTAPKPEVPAVAKAKGAPAAPEASKKAPPEPPLYAGWPTPAAAVVVSGDQLGYLEPCGCAEGQLGGLIRRAVMIDRLRDERKWPLALVDLGGLVQDPALARGGPEQAKSKFYTALRALGVMKYDAFALSPQDLKVGVDEAFGQFLNLPEGGPKVVTANVTMPGLEAKVVPSVRTTAGSIKIGITAVVDPDRMKALRDPSAEGLIQVKPIAETLPKVLADLEKDTAAQVLLVQGPPELATALAKAYPGFDLVVGTSPQGADPENDAETHNGGKTLVARVGQRGKYASVVGLFPGATPPLRYQRVTLSPKFDAAKSAVKTVIEDEFRETLKQQNVVENYPKHDYVSGVAGAEGATFVGVDACKKCHPNTVEFWSGTGHAKAYESLLKDPKPNVIHDAECVSCHTTGFDYNSGWKSADLTSNLKGNQCENCHGPASKHVADPTNKASRAPMHLTTDLADKNRVCLKCHDEDNSPHFEFAKYWEKIEHNGLDAPKANLKKKPAE